MYDLIVLGTGSAATGIASRCRAAGWRVAVCDPRPFGGTCPLRGCDPKKILIAGAEAIDWVERLREKSIFPAVPVLDWPALMRHKREFTDPFPAAREKSFADKGIDAFHGAARFVDRDRVAIDGREVQARHIVIATGAEPMHLPINGYEHLATNDDFLALESLPGRVVLIGAGYIGLEFATIAAAAGAQVTVLEMGTEALRGFEPFLVTKILDRMRNADIQVLLEHKATRIERTANGYRVAAERQDQTGELVFKADLVVHGAGRVPALAGLDVEGGGIAVENKRLVLNEYLQSTGNPLVYAAGDAAAPPLPLTPVAALHARTVAANLLEGNHAVPDYTGIPTAVFTTPPLARVGLLEAEAEAAGKRYRVASGEGSGWYSSRKAVVSFWVRI
jgi:glutathione reductase (NADPH)